MKEKIYNAVNNILFDKKLYIYIIIVIAYFGIFCHMQFAPDTYAVLSSDAKGITTHLCSCGRFVTGVFIYIFKAKIPIANDRLYYISYGIAMTFMVLSMYKLDRIINKEVKNRLGVIVAITSVTIINVFSLEMFLYIEKGIMALGIFMCILALEQLIRLFKGKKSGLFLGLVFMFVSNCCYQGNVGMFIAIAIVFTMKYSSSVKKFFINNVFMGIMYVIPALANYLLIKFLFVNSRVKGEVIIAESIKKVIEGTQKMLFTNYGLLPKGLFVTVIGIIIAFSIYKTIVSKASFKRKSFIIFTNVYLIVGTILVTIVPQFLQDTSSIWFVARSSYPMGCLVGTLLLNIYLYCNDSIRIPGKLITISIVSCLMLIQFVNFNRFSLDNYIGNYVDMETSLIIKEMVDEYEKNTGKKVCKVAIYADSATQFAYPKVKVSGDINIKAYSTGWSTISILRHYIGKYLVDVESDKEIEQYFAEKNWTSFSEEQIIIKDNTLHICLY